MTNRKGILASAAVALIVAAALAANWNGFRPDRIRLSPGQKCIVVGSGSVATVEPLRPKDPRYVTTGTTCLVVGDEGDVLDLGRDVLVRFDLPDTWTCKVRREKLRAMK